MDKVHVIRHKVLVEGLSQRRVARELGVNRATVKRYVEGAPAQERKATERERPVAERVGPRLAELLAAAPEFTHRKQQLTAHKLWELCRAEGLAVSERFVRSYVQEWKRQRREVFIALEYPPGDLAQIDFFEVDVRIDGALVRAHMFLLRMMHSGRDFAWLYPRQDQICFLDGHVRAFTHLGAVPRRGSYDNLKPAVKKILLGSEREMTPRFAAMAAHYVLEPSFCRPGTGHDKGGVESRGKAIRLQHLVPIPEGNSLEEISRALQTRLDGQAETERKGKERIIDLFAQEQKHMLPLPAHAFVAAATRSATISTRALAHVEGAHYSVPCRWAGLCITAHIDVDHVELVGPDEKVRHPRKRFGERIIDYRHYLPELARKPQAVRQIAGALMQQLGEPFGRTWRLLVDESGPVQAARVFARVCAEIVAQGERVVAAKLEHALKHDIPVTQAIAKEPELRPTLSEHAIPESLQGIYVETARAADYDLALRGVQ